MRRVAWAVAVVLLVQVASGQAQAGASAGGLARPDRAAAPATELAPSSDPPPASAYGFGYDDQGRLIEASDPAGSTAAYQWDRPATCCRSSGRPQRRSP